MKSNMFMREISFKKQFNGFDYIENVKKVNYFELKEIKTGKIIGACYKYEGLFEQGCRHIPFQQEYEPNRLVNRKRVNFWKVLVDFNREELVKKEHAILSDKLR